MAISRWSIQFVAGVSTYRDIHELISRQVLLWCSGTGATIAIDRAATPRIEARRNSDDR